MGRREREGLVWVGFPDISWDMEGSQVCARGSGAVGAANSAL